MSKANTFKSLKQVIQDSALEKKLAPALVGQIVLESLEKLRNVQEILHFETVAGPLGPGRLINFDMREQTATIQL